MGAIVSEAEGYSLTFNGEWTVTGDAKFQALAVDDEVSGKVLKPVCDIIYKRWNDAATAVAIRNYFRSLGADVQVVRASN
jgi:hypothetical protein